MSDVKDLRVLVVDDEQHARDDLTWLLGQSDAVCEVLDADSGAAALRLLNERDDIDGVFVDVQMPGLDGVELVKVLKNYRRAPAIAFVTAYDEYAVDAFDLDVCDYLVKPVNDERLTDTLRRMRDRVHGHEPTPDAGALVQLTARVGNRQVCVDRDDVTMIEAAGDYVRVVTDDDTFLVRDSISSLTSAWSGAGFVRIHRSHLVRLDAIDEVRTIDGVRCVLVRGRELPVSRRYTRLLLDRLGERR